MNLVGCVSVERIQAESEAQKAKHAIHGDVLPKRLRGIGAGNDPFVLHQALCGEREISVTHIRTIPITIGRKCSPKMTVSAK